MFPVCVFRFLLFSHLSVLLLSGGSESGSRQHDDCPDWFDCGNLGKISFPLTTVERQECGALAIRGCDNPKSEAQHVQLKIGGRWFQVTKIDSHWYWHSHTTIVYVIDQDLRKLLKSGSCKVFGYNITLPPTSPLGSFSIDNNITLFTCNRTLNVSSPSDCLKSTSCGYGRFIAPPDSDDLSLPSLAKCSTVQLPMNGFASGNPFTFLTAEIPIQFQPSDDCAQCYHDHHGHDRREPRGHCLLDNKGKFYCAKRKDGSLARKLGLGLGLGVGSLIIFALFLTLCYRKWKCGPARVQLQSRNTYADPYPDPDTETDRIFFGIPVFSYKELQEATKNFDPTRKLGEGGFGTVYHGKLVDGREVAVKHLFEHNYRRMEQFMNEIETLTRLRHVNLVSLYGCTSRHSRELLLVYEYIPNGTVASHLHGDLARAGLLTWPIRMQIAIETATALAYLHASDIIHRDVKTNNILLDINFSVKVADFGLSRFFPNDVSHVSTAPQGSPGYLDPEYFQCYQLTGKSDVYSFGVVLIELISSMPAVYAARERGETNLANLATKKIREGALSELVDPSLGFESDHGVKRKLTSVAELAFQCVQGDKELRPSMDEVLKALKEIEGGNYEPEHLEKGDDGAGISHSEEVHPPTTAS